MGSSDAAGVGCLQVRFSERMLENFSFLFFDSLHVGGALSIDELNGHLTWSSTRPLEDP